MPIPCIHGKPSHRKCEECRRKTVRKAEEKYDMANREARNAAAREYRKNNPDVMLIRKYNITTEDKNEMLKFQDGHCALCLETEGLEIDHDHGSKVFRGLLCDRHNRGLGFFTPAELARANMYVNAGLL